MVTPEANNINVLSKGNSKALIASIPKGGHSEPNSTAGASALWKYAQKIAKKNKASDAINKATPIFKPFCTAKVWLPIYVPSDITSLNQKNMLEITSIKGDGNHCPASSKLCIANTPVVVKVYRLIQVKIGQGEGDTRWKGCPWKTLLYKFDIRLLILLN